MKKLSKEEIFKKMLNLDKFEILTQYYYYAIYIDGTGFTYNVIGNTWYKLIGSYVYTYPIPYGFYGKIINETGSFVFHEDSSIDEVLETVPDDIRDTILFNLNLFG